MRLSPAQFEDLRQLIDELLEGELTGEGVERLEDLVCNDDEAAEFYWSYSNLHGMLKLSGRTIDEPLLPDDATSALQVTPKVRRFYSRPTPLALSVAALVVGLLVTAMAFMTPPFYRAMTQEEGADNAPPRIVARLTGSQEPVWAEGQIGTQHGAQLMEGHRIDLKSGLVEIKFNTGSRIVLEGPAELVLRGDNAGRLTAGKLVARVPAVAKGFEIETPAGKIVDLGTEFGVQVSGDQVETHVFVGEVLVQTTAPRTSKSGSIRLKAGQAVWFEERGIVKSDLPADEKRFNRRTGFANLAHGKPIVHASPSWPGESQDPRYVPNHVVDGRVSDALGSFWLGRNQTPDEHFTIDLKADHRIERIELVQTHNGAANDRGTKDFEIWASAEVSEDETLTAPQLVASGTLPDASGAGARLTVYVLGFEQKNLEKFEARYLEFVAKTYYGVGSGLNEIRVLGEPVSVPNQD